MWSIGSNGSLSQQSHGFPGIANRSGASRAIENALGEWLEEPGAASAARGEAEVPCGAEGPR